MFTTNVIDGPQFDYVNKGNPTIDVNPKRLYATWLNIETGELFICRDASKDTNIWEGQLGTTVSSEYDPYFDSVQLLLHGDGLQGGSSIIDSSNRSRSLTSAGTVITSENHYKFGGSSLYFDGGTFIEYPASAGFDIGFNDFTIEAWVYLSGPAKVIDANGYRVSYILVAHNCHLLELGGTATDTGANIGVWDGTYASYAAINVGYNEWFHVAQSRVSGVIYHFLNGGLLKSESFNYSLNTDTNVQRIGGDSAAGWERNLWGYIDDLRFTNGIGRYTTDFVPPKVELYSL